MNSRINLDNKEAVVLHSFDYRDSSLIVHFFISDFGKVSAIAKGVKGRKKSRLNHQVLLQPFQKLIVSLTGKYELLTLKSVENTAINWKLSGKSLYCAYYINELLLRLLPSHTDCQDIFQLYHHVLTLFTQSSILSAEGSLPADGSLPAEGSSTANGSSQVNQQQLLYEVPLRLFELKLLEFLGYGLNLSNEIQSGLPVKAEKQYHYVIESGPGQLPMTDIHTLPVSGRTLINLSNGQLNDRKTLQESKQLLKWALTEQLGNKPLKSRELFKQLYC